jgi:hypothetical protein
MDAETGLYYYGARYLDPKTSRWLSGDPAMADYIPVAPNNDEARKHNQSLPGQGGVFNYVNLHAYHYAGNNPVKYTDPSGRQVVETAVEVLKGIMPIIEKYGQQIVAGLKVLGLAILTVVVWNGNKAVVDHIAETRRPEADEATQAGERIQDNAQAATSVPSRPDENISEYVPPPKELPGIPNTSPARPKTPVQGGGGLRKRWKDNDGNIYEWDYQHGEVEKYNPRGKHQGAYDPNTGEQTKPRDPKREVEP